MTSLTFTPSYSDIATTVIGPLAYHPTSLPLGTEIIFLLKIFVFESHSVRMCRVRVLYYTFTILSRARIAVL